CSAARSCWWSASGCGTGLNRHRTELRSRDRRGYTAPMNARNPLLLAALVVSLPLVIAGCGNKGPLVMPDEVESVDALEMPTDTVPVELDEPAVADPTASDPAVADPVPF